MNRTISSLFSAATIALIVLYGRSQQQTLLMWSCLLALALIYLAIIWIPQSGWSRPKYALAVSLVIALAVILQLSNHGRAEMPISLLLIPLILLLAREQQRYPWFIGVMTLITLIVLGILAPSISFVWTVIPVVIALYMSIRAINIYKEAYYISQQNIEALRAAHQELQQTHAALQEATVHSMRYAALSERARLAREIHDGLGHQLTSMIVQLQALEIMLPNDPAQAAKAVPDILEVARKAMSEVRQAIETWREDESSMGLVALQGLVSQYTAVASLTPEFVQEGDLSDWPAELSVALYRILQEALTNILRYAGATAVSIWVQESEQQVILTVSDNGCFTENKPLMPGYGIKGIMERTQALGGTCQVSQNQPHGLKLKVRIPIQQPEEVPAKVEAVA